MAVVANNLGDALWAAMKAQNGAYTPALGSPEDTKGRDFWRAFATAFYAYDLANRQVNPGTLAITPSNILDGTTVSPCSGNGAVTTGLGTTS